MKIADILQFEKNNNDTIILVKEGCFWRTYEQSAFRFVKFVKKFQVIKKYIKCVNQEIVFLGFPVNVFNEIEKQIEKSNLEILRKEEELIEIGRCCNDGDFATWKESLQFIVSSTSKNQNSIIDSIREFPILHKTPLEAMNFIMKLQNEIMIIT